MKKVLPDITNLMNGRYRRTLKENGGIFKLLFESLCEILKEPTNNYKHNEYSSGNKWTRNPYRF